MDKSIKIANHDLNIGEILDVLQSNCPEYQEITKNGGEVVNFTTKALSENKGHVSMVYKLTLEFSNKKILNFALKVPTADPFIDAGTRIGQDFSSARRMIEAMICPFHVRECQFYRQVSPLFDSWLTPKVYDIQDWILDQKQGYLLLEDLTQNGIVLEKGASLNDEQIKSAVKFLVKFHVESWKTENDKSWKGKFLDGQKVWGDLIQQNSKELENLEDNFKNKVDSETMSKIQKYSNYLKPIITNKEFHYWAYQESHLESNIKEVLCHGDFWVCNMFWKRDKDGNPTDEILALVDWQLFHQGSPAVDLTRFLCLNLAGKQRKQVENWIFDFYMKTLESELGGDKVPFTVEQLKKCYKNCFTSQMTSFSLIFMFANKDPKSESMNDIIEIMFHLLEDSYNILNDDLRTIGEKFSSNQTLE